MIKIIKCIKYQLLQTSKCYKVLNVTNYLVIQSTNCYKIQNVKKYNGNHIACSMFNEFVGSDKK